MPSKVYYCYYMLHWSLDLASSVTVTPHLTSLCEGGTGSVSNMYNYMHSVVLELKYADEQTESLLYVALLIDIVQRKHDNHCELCDIEGSHSGKYKQYYLLRYATM
jgi:hypothetical protein